MSFNVQKLLILTKSNLSIFNFVIHVFGVISRMHCQSQAHEDVSLSFLLRNLVLATVGQNGVDDLEALVISSCEYIKVVIKAWRKQQVVTWSLDEQKPYDQEEK